jgi:hypothetical protein
METVNHRENLEELAERVNLWTQVFLKGTAAGDLSIFVDHDFGRLHPDPYRIWNASPEPDPRGGQNHDP